MTEQKEKQLILFLKDLFSKERNSASVSDHLYFPHFFHFILCRVSDRWLFSTNHAVIGTILFLVLTIMPLLSALILNEKNSCVDPNDFTLRFQIYYIN